MRSTSGRCSNQRKSNVFPAKFAREAPTKSAVLYQSFFSETGLQNSREIGRFFREFVLVNPAKIDFFFPWPTRRTQELRISNTKLPFVDWFLLVHENLLATRRSAISYWHRDFTYVSSREMYQIKPHIDILYNPFLRDKAFLHFVLLRNLTVTEWKICRLLARQSLNLCRSVRPLSQYLICQELLTFSL